MSIDLSQLLPTFIEESLENVEEMEEALLKLDLTNIDAEYINQIFRSVHTIKGNSAIFKFSAIGDLAKTLENLLDNVRKKTLEVEQQHLNILLKSSDCLRTMLLEIKEKGETGGECSKELIIALGDFNVSGSKIEKKPDLEVPKILEKPTKENIRLAPTITSIRVATEKIDSLMNAAEALVITEATLKQTAKELGSKALRKFSNNLEDLEQLSRRLQETILRMRMVPIAFAINRFPRMVMELAKQEGKEIEFKIVGEQTEIDKTMVEKITDPLMHLIRNAIDHGIESPAEREKKQKDRMGIIELNAYQSGNSIIIDIKDNGAGLDAKKIKETAIKKGLLSADKTLTEDECYQLIFQPGFSTADHVTDISGRGVGLDVVLKNIHELGGEVEIIPNINAGAIFRLQLPLTLAIMDCQLIRVGTEFFAIPLSTIIELCQLNEAQITRSDDNHELYTLREETFTLLRLEKLFFLKETPLAAAQKLLMKLKVEEEILGLSCDEFLFQQQIVIKSIEENYQRAPGILGATVLGDGALALILDVKEIVKLSSSDTTLIINNVETAAAMIREPDSENSFIAKIGKHNVEYLCFLIENKEYAFNMQNIKEVCVWQHYASLPFSPSFVLGIINLRGNIIPIVDPRILFNLNACEYNFNNVIIVLQMKCNKKNIYVGVIVDSVTEICEIRKDDIEPPPEIENLKIKSRIEGVINTKKKSITLLMSDCFVSFSEQAWSVL